MWVAFVVALMLNRDVSVQVSPMVYDSYKECTEANDKVAEQVYTQKAVLAYNFQCIEVKKEDFVKNGRPT